jgi:hypothetical protein
VRHLLLGPLLLVAVIVACSGESATTGASSSSGSSGDGSSGGVDGSTPSTSGGTTSGGAGDAAADAPPAGAVDPPLGGSSKGTGGAAPVAGSTLMAQGITFRLIVPAAYAGAPTPLIVVFSGTEGGATMTQNLTSLGPTTKTDAMIRAVLDGVTYNGNGQAGATVLDEVRAKYNIDNDRTYLMGESAGTTAALKLGFHLRQSSFAAYWANDVNASDAPEKNATALGFAPHGQAGPGGDLGDATSIVTAMKKAGYRVPTPTPYDGPGSTQHGNPQQFIAALTFVSDKNRN